MKHYEFEISLFSDNELSEQETDDLFKHLAGCAKCRQELRDIMLLKQQSQQIVARNISDIHISHPAGNIFYKAGFYIAAAAAVLLILIVINKSPESIHMGKTPRIIQTALHEHPDTVSIQVTPAAPVKIKKIKKSVPAENYIHYISAIPSVKLSDDDVITHEYRNDL